ncbi:MAG: trypsin-like peptidase domain-containing protein [Colwellia sp.]|nr:trypsin-like peptidase domain-containing protein [Colwellia sp.]
MKNKLLWVVAIIVMNTPLWAAENKLPKLYKKLLLSVVTLHTFQDKILNNKTQLATSANGLGSGVIISADGLIVTAAHVVHTADSLHVEFDDGIKRQGKIISSLPWADLALVKVDGLPDTAKVAELGDSSKVEIGEQVFVIGAPLGLNKSLTVGYISGFHPVGSRPSAPMAEFFQTDAAINPGNSGGPMFNMSGDIIGIASHIQTQSGGSQGLGFTVTSETVKQLLLNRGYFWSGIEIFPLDPRLADVFHLPQTNGVLVQRVARDSFAYKAGLKAGTIKATIEGKDVLLGGDIILTINGQAIDSQQAIEAIMKSIKEIKAGSIIELVVWRKGKKHPIAFNIPVSE